MLLDFSICIDTRFIFGGNAHEKVGEELAGAGIATVLLHHDNGAYLYAEGLLEGIKADLHKHGIRYYELGGVLPNPRLSLVYEGIRLVREEAIDFILAIGGGSVIDSAKAIALGAVNDGDVWEFFRDGRGVEKTLPVGVLLTCPATGSESSAVTVINNTEQKEKLLVSNPLIRPRLVFMNPRLTYSLPRFLTACGIVDMFSHTCERYFAPEEEIGVIDRMAEGILKTLVDIGPKVLKDPANYSYRAEIMWIGTIAHNNTVGIGRIQDWATHEIGNELSALYDTPHGATLSIIMCSWMEYVYKKKPERFARYASEIFGVSLTENNILEAAKEGILRTREYFKALGMPVSFRDYQIPTDRIEEMLNKIAFRGEDNSIGGLVRLNREDVRRIYKMSF